MGGNSSSSTPSPPEPLIPQWRPVDWSKKEVLLKRVRTCDRGDEDVKHIRIMLYGPIGAGKSSFVNSASSCLRERMTHGAAVDTLGSTSFTLSYQTHKIKPRKGKAENFPFVFIDIMGLEEDEDGIREEDIKLAMKGHVKDGYTFNPAAVISEEDPHYILHPTKADQIHVLVCVVPADKVNILDEAFTDKIRDIRLAARDLGIPQICIITKIDTVHDMIKKDLQNAYKMKIVKDKMEEFSAKVGIPMTDIFPVKNYHEEVEPDNDIDVLILKALQHMINLGEDFIEDL